MRLDLVNFRAAGVSGAAPSLLAEWRVGAILEAVAVRDVRNGQLWLDIGGQRHPARLASGEEAAPEHGEKLQVRVLRNSPVLALETLSIAKPARSADAVVIADALRRYVPKQDSPALALSNIAWLSQAKTDAAQLPKSVVQAAAQLWQALPTPQMLSEPELLEAAVLRSGAFLEAQLAAGEAADAQALAGDLKQLLLSLSKTLRDAGARPEAARHDHSPPAPTPLSRGPLAPLPSAPATFALIDAADQQLNELARQTDGALARITSTQLANSAAETSSPALLVEIPLRNEDRAAILRLRIEREGGRSNGGAEQADAWSVEAAMDLGAPGGLHARVALRGRRIGVQLRAETPAVVEALAARSPELEALLRSAGLEVDRVVCLHGLPAGDAGGRPTRLLDVRA